MNIYIDFDRTLFDCDRFLSDFYALIEKYEIPKSVFKKYQIQCKKQGFNPYIILKQVEETSSFDNQIYQDLDNLLSKTSEYLYSDAIDFLEYLKKYNIIILTKGNDDYQRKKILNSQINNYYNELIVTMNHKGKLNLDYEHSVFIDDNPLEIESVLKHNPKEIIRIKRENSKYYDAIVNEDIKTVSSLREIIDKKLL